jgi:hypothetical protein
MRAMLMILWRMTWWSMSRLPKVMRVCAYLIASSMHTRHARFEPVTAIIRSWLNWCMIGTKPWSAGQAGKQAVRQVKTHVGRRNARKQEREDKGLTRPPTMAREGHEGARGYPYLLHR